MMYVALGVIGFGAFCLLCKILWSKTAPNKHARIVLIASIALAVVLGVSMLRGFPPIAALLAMVTPFLRVIWRLIQIPLMFSMFNQMQTGPRPWFNTNRAQTEDTDSETQTSELSMKLNHQTGTMTGTVSAGEYSGRTLDSLSDEELHQVYIALQEEKSKRLLEAYVARHRPHLTDAEGESDHRIDEEEMSVKRAADILGIEVTATEEEVIAAHRRLMDRVHPDKGGSTYLAAELNTAKKVLLNTDR